MSHQLIAPMLNQPGAWRSWSALAKRRALPFGMGFTTRTPMMARRPAAASNRP